MPMVGNSSRFILTAGVSLCRHSRHVWEMVWSLRALCKAHVGATLLVYMQAGNKDAMLVQAKFGVVLLLLL